MVSGWIDEGIENVIFFSNSRGNSSSGMSGFDSCPVSFLRWLVLYDMIDAGGRCLCRLACLPTAVGAV